MKKLRNLSKGFLVTMSFLFVLVGISIAGTIPIEVINEQMIGDEDNLNGTANYETGFGSELLGFRGTDWSFKGDFTDMRLNTFTNPIYTLNFQFNGIPKDATSVHSPTLSLAVGRSSNDPYNSDPMITINDGPPDSPTVLGTRIGDLAMEGYNKFDTYRFDLTNWLWKLTEEQVYFSLNFNSPNESFFLYEGQIAIDWIELSWNETRLVDDGTGGGGTDPNAPVPEPATMILFGAGLVGLASNQIRKSKKAKQQAE